MSRLATPQLLAAIRGRLGVSQEELGRRLDVSAASVNAWERGRTAPRDRHRRRLDELAAELGIRQKLDVVVLHGEPVGRDLTVTMLHELEPSARIVTADGVAEGLLLCGAHAPDLVLLDTSLPGLDVAPTARAMGRVAQLRDTVLVLLVRPSAAPVTADDRAAAAAVHPTPLRRGVLAELLALVDEPATPRLGTADPVEVVGGAGGAGSAASTGQDVAGVGGATPRG